MKLSSAIPNDVRLSALNGFRLSKEEETHGVMKALLQSGLSIAQAPAGLRSRIFSVGLPRQSTSQAATISRPL